MKPLRRAWNRLRGVFGGFRRESDISAEFEAHIQMQTDDNLRLGMSPAEARRTALLKFGGIEASREAYREQRGLPLLEAFARDVRYALRGMRKSPGFTAVAVLCLALGIGANTAMFTLMNAVLLRSLPVKDPERLVLLKSTTKGRVPPTIRATSSGHGSVSLSYASLAELRKNRVLSDLFAFVPLGFNNQSVTVTVNGVAGAAGGEMVTGTYFSGLGVAPVLGRVINDDDLQPGAPSVTVIGYGYWSRQFGREPSVLGRNLTINGSDYSVVGVAPPDFYGVNPETVPDVWIPLRDHPGVAPWGVQLAGGKSIFADRSWWWCMIMGRLKPGVTGEQARAELDVLFRQGLTDGLNPPPPAERVPHLDLLPAARGFNDFGRRYSQPLYILLGATGLVLL
ncbi:MAG TPA: ABC transporter permease, partial [Bryobacteraceae bacterium]